MNNEFRQTTITLARDIIFRLHPVAIQINHEMVVQAFGPAVASFAPSIAFGRRLTDCFHVPVSVKDRLSMLTEPNQFSFKLVSKEQNVTLNCALYTELSGYLIVAKPTTLDPVSTTAAFQISDFSPDDLFVDLVLQIALQQGLREDAEKNAKDLTLACDDRSDMLAHLQRVTGFISHEFSNLLSIIELNCDRMTKLWTEDPNLTKTVLQIKETASRGGNVSQWLRALSGDADLTHREPLDDFLRGTSGLLQALCGPRATVTLKLEAGTARLAGSVGALMDGLISIIRTAVANNFDGGHAHITTALLSPSAEDETKLVEVSVYVHGTRNLDGAELLSTRYHSFSKQINVKTSIAEFVRSTGGKVSFRPDSRCSGTVTMQIPQYNPPVHDNPPAVLVLLDPPVKTPHLVVVEDEAAALEALCELLEFEGFTTTGCTNAEDALTVLAEQPHAVLLTDVVLPKMDGLTLAHWATKNVLDRKVVIMTGHIPNYAHYDEKWVFMQKPLDVNKLADILRAAR